MRRINLNEVKKKPHYIDTFLFLLILSLYFGRLNIYVGFSLKPFMIITIVTIVLSVYIIKISKLYIFEFFMILFIILHSATALKFNYPLSSIRFIVLYLIIIIYYFTSRWLVTRVSITKLELIISKTGLVGVICSLIYYIMGLFASGFNYRVSNIHYFGLLIDRSIPRLTGLASTDPNIFVFFITLYFFYTLVYFEANINKIGWVLSLVAVILSFSRGAYISILLGIIIWLFFSENKKMKLKWLLGILSGTILLFIISDKLPIDPINYITNRFLSFGRDGGSGRFTLWMNALTVFKENPITGIGINSIKEYYLANYSRAAYVHNSFLEVLVEAGIIGFISYLLFWLSILVFSIKIMLLNKKAIFIFITLVAMFFQMNSLSLLYNEAFYFVIVLLYRYSREYLYKSNNVVIYCRI